MPGDQYDETVAVINSNEDTVEMLRYALQSDGFSSVDPMTAGSGSPSYSGDLGEAGRY